MKDRQRSCTGRVGGQSLSLFAIGVVACLALQGLAPKANATCTTTCSSNATCTSPCGYTSFKLEDFESGTGNWTTGGTGSGTNCTPNTTSGLAGCVGTTGVTSYCNNGSCGNCASSTYSCTLPSNVSSSFATVGCGQHSAYVFSGLQTSGGNRVMEYMQYTFTVPQDCVTYSVHWLYAVDIGINPFGGSSSPYVNFQISGNSTGCTAVDWTSSSYNLVSGWNSGSFTLPTASCSHQCTYTFEANAYSGISSAVTGSIPLASWCYLDNVYVCVDSNDGHCCAAPIKAPGEDLFRSPREMAPAPQIIPLQQLSAPRVQVPQPQRQAPVIQPANPPKKVNSGN